VPRTKEVFTIYPRTLKNGKTVYYYRTYDENGKRTTGRTTNRATPAAARNYVMGLYRDGKLIPKKTETFDSFTENFWVWGKCRYITRCNTMGKKSISKEHAHIERGYLENHVRPWFGKKSLTSITTKDVEDFVIDLKNNTELADGTINHLLKIVKIAFAEALREKLIYENPTKDISYLKVSSKERGILNVEEVKKLFDPRTVDSVWGGDKVTYAVNLFAASTGVRRGEILGLLNKYLHKEYVEIAHSWGIITGIKETTKTKEARFVPISPVVSKVLHKIAKGGPDAYLFSLDGGKSNYPAMAVHTNLYKALEKIGIDKDQRTARNITFHSWRHFFNTLCLARNISTNKVQAVTGHRTNRMTDHYTHFNLQDYQEIVDVQTSLLN